MTLSLGGMAMYRVEKIPEKGRGLIADVDIQAGTTILIDEPYVACIDSEHTETRSFYSFKESPELMRCAKCKFARYQSVDEQRADWKDGHKQECKSLQVVRPSYHELDVRVVARILWKSLENRKAKRADPAFAQVLNLVDNWSSLDAQAKTYYGLMAAKVWRFMDSVDQADPLADEEFIAKLLARVEMNAFTTADLSAHLGTGLYTLGGLINHSCRPNSIQTYEGRTLVVRASKDISAGQEITVTYIPTFLSRLERRNLLLEKYHFDIFSHSEQFELNAAQIVSRGINCCNVEIKVNFWHQPPCELDLMDMHIVAVSQGPPTGRLVDFAGFVAQSTEDTKFPGMMKRYSASTGPKSAKKAEFIVDVWGNAFKKGGEFEGDIQWSKILDLVKFAAPCLDLVRMKNSNFDWHLESAMKKLTIEEKVWSLGQVADRLERELLRKPNAIHLGPNNVVRQEALEARAAVSAELGKRRESYAEQQKCRASKLFLKSVNPSELMMVDRSLASLANLLGEKDDARMYATSALETLRVLYPNDTKNIEALEDIIK